MQTGNFLLTLLKRLQSINPVVYTIIVGLIIGLYLVDSLGIYALPFPVELKNLVGFLALALMGAKVAPENDSPAKQ